MLVTTASGRDLLLAGQKAGIVWAFDPDKEGKAHQRFADGTSADWTGVEGDRRPAAVTKLTAAR